MDESHPWMRFDNMDESQNMLTKEARHKRAHPGTSSLHEVHKQAKLMHVVRSQDGSHLGSGCVWRGMIGLLGWGERISALFLNLSDSSMSTFSCDNLSSCAHMIAVLFCMFVIF